MKSAKVRQPKTKGFSPTEASSSWSLAKYFSMTPTLAVSWSLLKKSALTAPAISLKTERKVSTLAWSWAVFPSSSFFPHLLMMYLWIAADSVSSYSPSMRQGKLGKLSPRFTLSFLNQSSPLVYCLSSNSTPENERSSLGTCPRPRIPQYPSLTFLYFGWLGMVGGRKGSTSASGLSQQDLTPGSCSKLCLILKRKPQFFLSSVKVFSIQQSLSAMMKSARVTYPRAKGLSPTKSLRLLSLGVIFSKTSVLFSVVVSGAQRVLSSLMISLNTPRMFQTCPSSWAVFPKSSLWPERRTMYLRIEEDSVNLKSPSMRYGRFGNSNPRFFLSSSNHFSLLSYCTSVKGVLVQARRSRMGCARPRIFQQPRVTLVIRRYVYKEELY